jgi:hypothetical protein
VIASCITAIDTHASLQSYLRQDLHAQQIAACAKTIADAETFKL